MQTNHRVVPPYIVGGTVRGGIGNTTGRCTRYATIGAARAHDFPADKKKFGTWARSSLRFAPLRARVMRVRASCAGTTDGAFRFAVPPVTRSPSGEYRISSKRYF